MRTHSLLKSNRLTLVVLLLALVASLLPVTPAYAANIVVNTSADNYNPADGKCTLREAIDAANLNARSGPAAGECAAGSPAGVDAISLDPQFAPYVITVGSGGTGLKQLPFIISPITITGLGAANTVIQAALAPDTATWRVFQVTPAGNLTLGEVTVRYGRCNGACTVEGDIEPDAGGGIYNSGTFTLKNSIVSGNRGTLGGGIYNNGGTVTVIDSDIVDNRSSQVTNGFDGGGGIRNSGNLTLINSAVTGNTATAGGGILNTATLTVTNSAITNNTASGGGGIFTTDGGTLVMMDSTISGNTTINSDGAGLLTGGTVTITNSTISGNNANGDGGGIFNGAALTMANTTISDNTAIGAGAIGNVGPATLTMTNSTIARNTSTFGDGGGIKTAGLVTLRNTILYNNIGGNCLGLVTNGGNNLDNGSTCGFGFNSGSMSNTNPILGSLAYNGGPTQTIKLLAGSPAIDNGNPNFCAASPVNGRDQRGVLRPLGGGCDMGAFETSHGRGPDTVGVFRPSNGFLFLKNINLTGFADLALNYGLGGDYPVVGDWDGDGDDTIGVYRNGAFYLRNSNTVGFADLVFAFGVPGDQPIVGDWNGNGIDSIGVYRSSSGQFFLRNSNSTGAPDITFFLGNPGDVGIAGDWDGDGDDTTGVFRPSNGFIFLKNTNGTGFADIALNYGLAGDKPVTGDWNFDGIDTIGVLRGNTFFLRNSNTNGFADMSFALGNPGDHPIAGNWDGQP